MSPKKKKKNIKKGASSARGNMYLYINIWQAACLHSDPPREEPFSHQASFSAALNCAPVIGR